MYSHPLQEYFVSAGQLKEQVTSKLGLQFAPQHVPHLDKHSYSRRTQEEHNECNRNTYTEFPVAPASSKKTELKLCTCITNSSFPHQAFAELIILGNHMVLTHSFKHFHLFKMLVKFTVIKCKCEKRHKGQNFSGKVNTLAVVQMNS